MGHFEDMKALYGVPFTGRTEVADSFTDVYAENRADSETPSATEIS